MKHPFWIVNSILFFLVVCAVLFMYFSRVRIPAREDIEPMKAAPKQERRIAINIKKIYEHDLFGTVVSKARRPELELIMPVPEPPHPQQLSIPEIPKPQFLDPLDITLKGIIVVGSNDAKNRAILEDNKTKQENTYKVGDSIQDAQLIRIFRNKVIFLRINGQQEVLYLREDDAKRDPAYAAIEGWDEVIQKINDTEYLVSPKEFVNRIASLGQVIDMLALTSAYQKGSTIGIRVGTLESNSLGSALGLQSRDIITEINGVAANSTDNRLAIYKDIISKRLGDTVTVTIIRNNQPHTITYTYENFATDESGMVEQKEKPQMKLIKEQRQQKILEQKYKLAPTAQQIRRKERRLMLEKGKAPN